ncbi:hypothetical protein DFO56_107206 [Kosakonia sp. AG348]|nr:hypothetical protein DFO56_107206 [Kosakonia sp. AG348]
MALKLPASRGFFYIAKNLEIVPIAGLPKNWCDTFATLSDLKTKKPLAKVA